MIGEPLHADGAGARVPRAAIRDLTVRLHDELQRLFDIAQIRAG